MGTRANYFKIGLFVVVAIMLAIGAVVILGVGALFKNTIPLETYFDESVQGLDVGAPIKRRGVKIGTVKDIDFVRSKYRNILSPEDARKFGGYVVVTSSVLPELVGLTEEEITSGITMAVDSGLRVQLATQGVTGVVHLEVVDLDPKEHPPLDIKWKPYSPYIPSAPSKLTVLGTAISKIAKDLEQADIHEAVENFDKLITSTTKLIANTNLDVVSAQVSQTLAELEGTLKETRRLVHSPEMNRLLTHAAKASVGAREAIVHINKASRDFSTTAKDLPMMLTRINTSIRKVDRLLTSRGQDLEETMSNLRLVSENLLEITNRAKRYPSHVILGDPPPPSEFPAP